MRKELRKKCKLNDIVLFDIAPFVVAAVAVAAVSSVALLIRSKQLSNGRLMKRTLNIRLMFIYKCNEFQLNRHNIQCKLIVIASQRPIHEKEKFHFPFR